MCMSSRHGEIGSQLFLGLCLKLDSCLCSHAKNGLHPDPCINRVITVAERKRIQSIPDDVPLKVKVPACTYLTLKNYHICLPVDCCLS